MRDRTVYTLAAVGLDSVVFSHTRHNLSLGCTVTSDDACEMVSMEVLAHRFWPRRPTVYSFSVREEKNELDEEIKAKKITRDKVRKFVVFTAVPSFVSFTCQFEASQE